MIAKTVKLVFVLGALFLLGWLIYESSTIILYVIFSSVVALIGRPIYHLFEKVKVRGKQLPGVLMAALTIFSIFGIFALIIGFFLPAILMEAKLLSTIDVDKIQAVLQPSVAWINDMSHAFNMNKNATIEENDVIAYLLNSVDMGFIPNLVNSIVGLFGNFLIALFSIAFISFFFIRDQNMMTRLILLLTPKSLENSAITIVNNTHKTLSRYFIGLVIQVAAITLCVFIGLSIIGVKNALLIAFFTGIANLVPYLGPWIGATFGTFILIANNIDYSYIDVIQPKILGLIAVFGITQMLDNYIFQPTIFSSSINAHPLEIFLVILVAGTIGGVGGMIAAIPVYAFLRIVFQEMDKEFKWLETIKEK